MNISNTGKPSIKNFSIKRRLITVTEGELVTYDRLYPGIDLPLLLQPRGEEIDPIAWASTNKDFINRLLMKHGGVLFRGFNIRTADAFERFIRAISEDLLEYHERSSPRSQVSGKIYTSTDHPATEEIFLHNENSYQQTLNMKIFFYCMKPATIGGETPIADCRIIYRRIPPEIRRKFIEKKWMYVRNYGDGLGLPWQTVFQTSDRKVVEEHCRKNDIEVEWKSGNRLRTRAVLPAVARHPHTGEMVWFNHATFFHISTLDARLRQTLLQQYENDEDLPTNTYYGDGTAIEAEVLDLLRGAYRKETVLFPWKRGDLLLLDNMLAAHGRTSYQGERSILVGMSEPFRRTEL
jgi:alpha-ketoglutarate-dependent taurine dioxygenase